MNLFTRHQSSRKISMLMFGGPVEKRYRLHKGCLSLIVENGFPSSETQHLEVQLAILGLPLFILSKLGGFTRRLHWSFTSLLDNWTR